MAQNTDLFHQHNGDNGTSKVQEMEFDQEKLCLENGQEELLPPETVTVSVMQEKFVEDMDPDSLFTQLSDPLDVDPLYVDREEALKSLNPSMLTIVKNELDDDYVQDVPEFEEENIRTEFSNSPSKLCGEKDDVQFGSPCNKLSANWGLRDNNSLGESETGTVGTGDKEQKNAGLKTLTAEDRRLVKEVSLMHVSKSVNVSNESTEAQICTTVDEHKRKNPQNTNIKSQNTSQYKVSVPKTNAEGKLVVLLTRCKVAERLLYDPDPSFHSVKIEVDDSQEEVNDESNEEEITNETLIKEDISVDTDKFVVKAEEPISLDLLAEQVNNVAEFSEMNMIARKEILDTSSEETNLNLESCVDCHKIFKTRGSLYGHRPRCIERKRKAELKEAESLSMKPSGPGTRSLRRKHLDKRSSLLNRMVTHHTRDTGAFRCRVCNQGFSSSVNLKKHSHVHMVIEQYNCDECQKKFGSMMALKVHKRKMHYQSRRSVPKITKHVELNLNLGQDLLPCETCYQVFPTSSALTKHKVIHNEQVHNTRSVLSLEHGNLSEKSPLERDIQNSVLIKTKQVGSVFHCKICNEVFNTCQSLNKHGIVHARQLLQPYLEGTAQFCRRGKKWCCPVCAKARSSKWSLKEHLRLHLNIKPFNCHVCKKSFTQKFTWKRHIQKHHSEEKTYPCEICGIVYYNPTTLKLHKRKHKQSHQFLCSYCGKFFTSQQHLTEHKCSNVKRRSVHSSSDKKIQTSKLHMKAHLTNNKVYSQAVTTSLKNTHKLKYTCTVCGKSFASRSSLNIHMYIHTGNPNQCYQCKKQFSTSVGLDNHIRTLHRKESPYKCSWCDKSYCRQDSLSYHKQRCSFRKLAEERRLPESKLPSSKPVYKCFQCNTKYTTVGYLSRHNNIYHPMKETDPEFLFKSKGKRFPCNSCGQTYSNPTNLRIHCNRFHPEKNEKKGKGISEVSGSQSYSFGKTYKRNYSGGAFGTYDNLRLHYNSTHKDKDKVTSTSHSQISLKRYQCDHCTTTFSSPGSLRTHSHRFHKENGKKILGLQSQTNEKGYKCDLCEVIYSTPRNLQVHFVNIHKGHEKEIIALQSHTNQEICKCDFCDFNCSTQNTLQMHCYRKHRVKKNLQINKKTLSQSSNFHSIDKRFRCHSCNIKFLSRSYLQSHINIVHGRKKGKSSSNDQPYKCDYCDLTCLSQSSLLNHICLSNDKNEKLTKGFETLTSSFTSNIVKEIHSCDKCKRTFNDNHQLISHTCSIRKQKLKEKNAVVVRSSKKTYECKQCGAIFLLRYKFLKHKCNSYVEKKSYHKSKLSDQYKNDCKKVCLVCGESFTLLDELKDHMLVHTNQELSFNCPVCSETFPTARSLGNHSRTHIQSKLNRSSLPFISSVTSQNKTGAQGKYKCKWCSKVFPTSYSLKRHMMMHTGERPYSCKVCRRSFREKYRLVCHMKTTHNLSKTPFYCVICEKGFFKKGNLIKHQSVCN